MLLKEDTIQTLIELNLDIIGISLAGTNAKTHNRIRKGTDLIITALVLTTALYAAVKMSAMRVSSMLKVRSSHAFLPIRFYVKPANPVTVIPPVTYSKVNLFR